MRTSEVAPIETGNIKSSEKILVPGNKGRKTYEVDGGSIDVNFTVISKKDTDKAKETKDPASELIVFLPGWSVDSDMRSAKVTGQAFADAGNTDVIIVDTKPKGKIENSLHCEAEAISKLIKESAAERVIVAGYSEGGIKAINLAAIIQNDLDQGQSELSVDGLVLMESMGLYDQDSQKKLVAQFVGDTIVSGKHLLNTKISIRSARFGADVLFGMTREAFRTNILGYPSRILSQIGEMMEVEGSLKDLKIPVILIQGEDDPVSNPNKVVPSYRELDNETLGYGRGKYLQKNVFSKSPFVRMIVGRKFSNHGIPVFRAEQVAKDSLYLLERFKRERPQDVPSSP